MKVSIINYGLSNLLSVQRAFAYLQCETEVIQTPLEIEKAKVLVLPGVGAFKDGMAGLNNLNLTQAIQKKVKEGTPILGICLGMQMLFEESEEFGLHQGLGLIPGRIVKISDKDTLGNPLRIPHINWSPLYPANAAVFDSILENTPIESETYFVHSYAASTPEKYVLAYTLYGGNKIVAVVQNSNVFGTQFHPEKSGKVGLDILKAYLSAAEKLLS